MTIKGYILKDNIIGFREFLNEELNKILETNFVKKEYIENVRIYKYKLVLVNK